MKAKKRMFTILGLSALSLSFIAAGVYASARPVATKAEDSENLYPSEGFEDIIPDGSTSYDFTTAKNGIGRIGGSVKALQETVGGVTNTYMQLTDDGGSDKFANTYALFASKLYKATTYSISFDFRKEAGWTTTDNIGFRFYTDAATLKDGEALAEKVNAGTTGEWFTVNTTYELSAAQAAVGSDSLQLWFHTVDGSTVNKLDVDNIKITYKWNTGENIFPSVGYETILSDSETSYDFAGGARKGVGQAGAAVKAIKETVAGVSNTYLQLSNGGGSDSFANTYALFPMKLTEAKSYSISFDFRKEAGWTTTDNVGFRFWTDAATLKDGEALATKVNAGTTGEWFTVATTYELSAAQAAVGADSLQLWFNTKDGSTLNVLDVDNVVITAIVPEALAPEVEGSATYNWHPENNVDAHWTIDLKGQEITSVKFGENDLASSNYAYIVKNKSFVINHGYLLLLDSGSYTVRVSTAKGYVDLVVIVYDAPKTIPETTDGYTLTDTLLGGTFEDYAIGLVFSSTQTEEAWGSLDSYDDPGVIIDDGTGNHALKLGRKEGSAKTYSSAFVMTSPDIEKEDIATFEFDYKMVTNNAAAITGKDTNVCFVGGSNTGYHQIKLDGSKNNPTVEGNTDEQSWAVAYTSLDSGYTHVKMSFIVDFAFLNSTNSIRFLMQIADDADQLLIDNVTLKKWATEAGDENPTITPATASFDYKNQQDLAFTVDLKSYSISAIKLDGKTVSSKNYSLDGTTLTVKKDYLATLANGDHVFTLSTLGGEGTFTITVSNVPTVEPEEPSAGLPGWGIALIVVGGVAVLGGAGVLVYFLLKKKHPKA